MTAVFIAPIPRRIHARNETKRYDTIKFITHNHSSFFLVVVRSIDGRIYNGIPPYFNTLRIFAAPFTSSSSLVGTVKG